MNFEAVLFIGNQSESKQPLNLKTSIDWLKKRGFHNYVDISTNANRPINLLEVLKQNNKLDGNDLLTLFGHVEILNQNLTRRHENSNRPQSTMITKSTPNPTSPKFKRDRWSCRLDSSKKPDPFTENKNHQSVLEIEAKINNSLHTFKSSSLRHMSHRNTQLDSVCKNNLHSANEINFKRQVDSKLIGISVDDVKNLIGCTKHSSLTTVMEQSITDESTNQNQAINENYSQLISSISDSNSVSSLDSNAKSLKSRNSLKAIQSIKPTANLAMKSNLSPNKVPEISVASNNSETPNLSPRCCSNDSDFLLPTTANVNLRISNDVPRSTGSNRRYFNSWGYDFELDSGVEELSNDSIDMGEAGRINFRTGSFMTRYRRNSKLSNNQSSPRSVLISPSQHCVNWAWCKDENNQPIVDNVEDELNPVLDSLFSDMDSLDNFRNILHNRRISNNFEEFNTKDTCKKELRPKDFIIRKPHLHNEKSNIEKNAEAFEDIENRQQTNSLTRQESENKFKKSSLKKSASARKRNHPFRWSSLARTNQPINSCRDLELSHLTLNQFLILKKLAMLRLTSLLESHIPSQKSQFNWKFPKLLSQKSKLTDTSTSIFGASLSYWQGRIGQPLPPVIYHALKYIRMVGPDSDGIFRRAGGKARITELKKTIEKTQDMTDFSKWQPYDVADMIKSYFRSLPECLMTNKFSSTLISIKTYIPEQNWFEAIQWVIINLPDENRLVLQSLLYFLSDLTKHSKTTQMTSYNLAVCLSPSLFHSPHVINSSSVSPIRMRKSIHGPDPRDLEDQKATHHCLKFMIDHAPSLFRLSEETINKARIQMEFERIISLSKLLRDCNDWYSWIRSKVEALINENSHKFKNWTSVRKDILKIHNDKSELLHGLELFYKKNNVQSDKSSEGINSIGTWRITAEIEAPASLILDKIQNSRHEWDLEIALVRIKREISDSVDICYMEVASNPPQTQRQMTLIRGCQRNIDGNINVLVSQSVDDNSPVIDRKPLKPLTYEGSENDHENNVINVLQDDVIIEYFPASQKSRINWLSRVDLRGYSSEWYFRQWSHVLIRRLIHLKVACAQLKI